MRPRLSPVCTMPEIAQSCPSMAAACSGAPACKAARIRLDETTIELSSTRSGTDVAVICAERPISLIVSISPPRPRPKAKSLPANSRATPRAGNTSVTKALASVRRSASSKVTWIICSTSSWPSKRSFSWRSAR